MRVPCIKLGLAVVSAVCMTTGFAQDQGLANSPRPGSDNTGDKIISGTAIRSDHSAVLSELLELHHDNTQAGRLAETPSGEINPHVTPDFLKLAPADPADVRAGQDTVQQRSSTNPTRTPDPLLSFPGYSNADNAVVAGRVTPPDTNGDVGLNHYVMYVNLGWMVFNKTNGAVVAGPFAGNTFWQGFGGVCQTQNAGDPIVLYDQFAGRWLFSQFVGTGPADGHQCVAVSDGENPLGPYTRYDFVVSPGAFNDYPKIGLWPDGYYMTTHEFNAALNFTGLQLTVFNRNAILAGNPNAGFVQFSGATTGQDPDFGAIPGHLEGAALPPAGTCNYLVHATDAQIFNLTGPDRYRFWEACVNFNNPAASRLDQINSINVPAFDSNLCNFSRNCIEQPNTQRLDSLGQFTMYRYNMRYFDNEGLLKGVVTNTVDLGGDRAGVQWAGIDINPVNNATAIGDNGDLLGVVDFGDDLSRWIGSGTLDQDGNIAIGYTRSSDTEFPSVYYTVHERGVDGAGAVQQEAVCVDGTGSTTGANRWGDYASASIDPVDQCTFWISNEYVETTGNFNWDTRICAFSIPGCGDPAPPQTCSPEDPACYLIPILHILLGG